MLEERARVVAVEADAVWVETVRQSTCGACSARAGCGHATLNRARAGSRARVRALTEQPLRVDDEVIIAIPEHLLLRGALRVYLLPLVLLFAGALLGGVWNSRLPGMDLSAALGVAGLLLGFVYNRWHSARHDQHTGHHPRVMRTLPSAQNDIPVCQQQ
jgi:sigma-E factor negative regulatory protein RseC